MASAWAKAPSRADESGTGEPGIRTRTRRSDYTAAMATAEFDIAIIGGGPTGSALAMLLARLTPNPASVALFQADGQTRYDTSVHEDSRVLALNEGSRVLLSDLNVWPDDAAAIHTIHVSQKGRLGRTLITREDFAVQALGHVVRYATLHAQMLDAARRAGVTLITESATLSGDSHRAAAGGLTLVHGEHSARARLVVRADGLNHTASADAYTQVALLGQARVSQPKPGWAYERFTREGPLAVLPHPDDDHAQSIVWCCSPARAESLAALPPDALAHEMGATFGQRLGAFCVQTPFKAFPLYKSLEPTPVQGRLVSIGNAAQTLHPVAGQGLNLGLRDAATLAHCLRDWLADPERDPTRALTLYVDLRRDDRRLTAAVTNTLSSVFTTGLPVLEHAAGLALLSLDTMPLLRAPLARHLMQGLRK